MVNCGLPSTYFLIITLLWLNVDTYDCCWMIEGVAISGDGHYVGFLKNYIVLDRVVDEKRSI